MTHVLASSQIIHKTIIGQNMKHELLKLLLDMLFKYITALLVLCATYELAALARAKKIKL